MAKIYLKIPKSKKHTSAAKGLIELYSYNYIPSRFRNKNIANKYMRSLIRQQFLAETNRRQAYKMYTVK